jgi:hypothetical protein
MHVIQKLLKILSKHSNNLEEPCYLLYHVLRSLKLTLHLSHSTLPASTPSTNNTNTTNTNHTDNDNNNNNNNNNNFGDMNSRADITMKNESESKDEVSIQAKSYLIQILLTKWCHSWLEGRWKKNPALQTLRDYVNRLIAVTKGFSDSTGAVSASSPQTITSLVTLFKEEHQSSLSTLLDTLKTKCSSLLAEQKALVDIISKTRHVWSKRMRFLFLNYFDRQLVHRIETRNRLIELRQGYFSGSVFPSDPLAQLRLQYTHAATQWKHLLRNLSNERGPWGDPDTAQYSTFPLSLLLNHPVSHTQQHKHSLILV